LVRRLARPNVGHNEFFGDKQPLFTLLPSGGRLGNPSLQRFAVTLDRVLPPRRLETSLEAYANDNVPLKRAILTSMLTGVAELLDDEGEDERELHPLRSDGPKGRRVALLILR
jgi:hypothetical protein